MSEVSTCPGCGSELNEVAAIGVLQTACGRIGYGLCRECGAIMQHGTDAARRELALRVELSLAADEDAPQ